MGVSRPGGATTSDDARGAGPWIALSLPPLAWFSFELGLAALVRLSCEAAGSWVGIAWGVFSLGLCGLAVKLAARPGEADTSRAWLARLVPFGAGVFALAIAFQTLAAWLVPSCAR